MELVGSRDERKVAIMSFVNSAFGARACASMHLVFFRHEMYHSYDRPPPDYTVEETCDTNQEEFCTEGMV